MCMRFRIEFIPKDVEEEIVIRCHSLDENVKKQCETIEALLDNSPVIVYHKEEQEFYFPSERILFFETDGNAVHAHTADDVFRVNYRLYQLETILPTAFLRVSKSAIVNTSQIFSLSKTLGVSLEIQFFNTHKQIYASKLYIKELKQVLSQRRR